MFQKYMNNIFFIFLSLVHFCNCKITKEMLKEIRKDISCSKSKYITKSMIYNEEILKTDPLVGVCSIINNNVRIDFNNRVLDFVSSRVNSLLKILQNIANKKKINNIRFLISFWDEPKEATKCPIFSLTKNTNENIIRIPLMDFILDDSTVLNVVNENKRHSWKFKNNKMFWRSKLTGSFDIKQPLLNPRFKLCYLSIKNPQVLDAKITGMPFKGEIENYINKEYKSFLSARTMEIDSLHYKYLPLMDGFACPTAFYWMMFAESVIFKVESKSNFHFSTSLVPFVHYIPISSDLSDLFEKYKWAEKNQDKCKKIIKNANNFAHKNLRSKRLYSYWEAVLDEYSKIYQDI